MGSGIQSLFYELTVTGVGGRLIRIYLSDLEYSMTYAPFGADPMLIVKQRHALKFTNITIQRGHCKLIIYISDS